MFSNQLPLNYNNENVPYIYPAILERYIFIKTQRSIFILQIPFFLELKPGLTGSSVGYRHYLRIQHIYGTR